MAAAAVVGCRRWRWRWWWRWRWRWRQREEEESGGEEKEGLKSGGTPFGVGSGVAITGSTSETAWKGKRLGVNCVP